MLTRRMTMAVAAAAIVTSIFPSGASGAEQAEGTADGVILTSDCLENQAFVGGDTKAVPAVLPASYDPVIDPSSGRPLLFVRALRCTIDGSGPPATFGSFGIVVESPDGTNCSANNSPVDVPPVCNWYVLSWVADDPRLVRWLRDESPDFPAAHVPHLVLEQEDFDPAQGGAPFYFAAAPPAPEPFAMKAVTRERPGELRVRGAYWREVREGTVRVGFATDDLVSGDATGVVSAPSGSLLAQLMGAEEAPYGLGYSAIAAERWRNGMYRKQVGGSDHETTTFDGSCSLKGDVTFEPGATLMAQPLRFEFTGEGSCSGKLNGSDITDLQVSAHQYGRAEGSCAQARTTRPGFGQMTFANGAVLDYNLEFTYQIPETDFTWYGSRSGKARGEGTFRTDRTPPDTTAKCATPTGVTEIPMDITLTTESTLVSRRKP